jgi:hypothetical protein
MNSKAVPWSIKVSRSERLLVMLLEGVIFDVSLQNKPKKKPSHITQVSTTFMLFHVDLLLVVGVN